MRKTPPALRRKAREPAGRFCVGFGSFVRVRVYINIPLLSLSATILVKLIWVRTALVVPMITTHMQILKQIPAKDEEFDTNIAN